MYDFEVAGYWTDNRTDVIGRSCHTGGDGEDVIFDFEQPDDTCDRACIRCGLTLNQRIDLEWKRMKTGWEP